MQWMTEHLHGWNGWIALLLYWCPLAMNAYGYTVRAAVGIQKDRAEREKAEAVERGYYLPSITVGTLVGYAALTIVPIANLFSSVFYVAPKLFGDFFEWCGRVLDVPLVPKRSK